MPNEKQVNFRLPIDEYKEIEQEGLFKGFKNISSFIRYLVRKNYKICEPNKDGIYNG